MSKNNLYLALATLLGLIAGYLNFPSVVTTATVISQIFINLLKLVSLPIIFLSIVSTASGMDSVQEIKNTILKLPADARADLVETLIASLPPEYVQEQEWSEIARRIHELDAGTARLLSEDEFWDRVGAQKL